MKACAALNLQHFIVRSKPLPALQHKHTGSAGIKVNLGLAECHLQLVSLVWEFPLMPLV